MRLRALVCFASISLSPACGFGGGGPSDLGTVDGAPFGQTPDGTEVEIFTLTNPNGVEVRAMTYGGIIVSLRVPDRDGQLEDTPMG